MHDLDSDDLPGKQKEPSTELSGKRKAAPKPSKDEVATLQAKDVSPLRKKTRLPFAVIKSSPKQVLFAGKTQVRVAPSSSARVKHLVGMDIKKIGGMQNIWDILLKSSTENLKTCYMLYKDTYPKFSSFPEKQRDVDFPYRSLSRLHQLKD